MSKIPLLFVGKLVNSLLLTAFPASSRKILSDFSFVTGLCKGLYKLSTTCSVLVAEKAFILTHPCGTKS